RSPDWRASSEGGSEAETISCSLPGLGRQLRGTRAAGEASRGARSVAGRRQSVKSWADSGRNRERRGAPSMWATVRRWLSVDCILPATPFCSRRWERYLGLRPPFWLDLPPASDKKSAVGSASLEVALAS